GDSFAARGELPMAEANWKESIRYDVKNDAALQSLFDLYVRQGNVDAAITTLQSGAVLGTTHQKRLLTLARRLATEGDAARARKAYAAAVAGAPADAALLSEYAGVLVAAGDLDAAIDPLTKSVA